MLDENPEQHPVTEIPMHSHCFDYHGDGNHVNSGSIRQDRVKDMSNQAELNSCSENPRKSRDTWIWEDQAT